MGARVPQRVSILLTMPMLARCILFLRWGLPLALAAACTPADPYRPDVVLLVLDTTRADSLGPYASRGRARTPFVDELASQALVFENAWTASTWTAPSTASILTGLLPPRHGIQLNLTVQAAENWRDDDDQVQHPTQAQMQAVDLVALSASVPTLAEHLQRAGYRTLGVGANSNVCDEVGLTRGFERIDVVSDRDGADMAVALRRLEAEVPSDDRPTFTYLHYMDPHAPYERRVEYCPHDDEESCSFRCQYRSEVRYLDAQLEALFAERPHWRDAIVIVVSDHGEEFREHGGIMHRYSVHQELAKAALIWRMPGLEAGRSPRPAHHIDIVPSVLRLLDLPAPREMDGEPLFVPPRGPEAQVAQVLLPADERALLTHRTDRRGGPQLWGLTWGSWRLLEEQPSGVTLLYNLDEDPLEQRDLSTQHPQELAQLRQRLDHLRSSLTPVAGKAVTVDLSRSLAEELLQLGYVMGEEDDGEQ